MKILMMGGLISPERKKEVYEKSLRFPNTAADAHQWNILNGLKGRDGICVEVANSPFVGTYPREYKDFYLPPAEWETDGVPVHDTAFLNLFMIRTIWRAATLYRAVEAWCERTEGPKILLVYSVHQSLLQVAVRAKNKFRDVKICLYVPDLPLFFLNDLGRGDVYRTLKVWDVKLMDPLIAKCDGYVLLTEQMNGRVNPDGKPYTVIEGIVQSGTADSLKADCDGKGEDDARDGAFHFVYTGKLDAAFGVTVLVAAFRRVRNAGVRLDLYGDGDATKRILRAAAQDSRIHYHGTRTRAEIMDIQRRADVLVNPRSPGEEFTRYSFPSKTMEYLLSGRPVLMHHLPGIPKEYDRYLNYFSAVDLQSMSDDLARMAKIPEDLLAEAGERGKKFILKEKNERVQGDKLVALLRKLSDEK